MIFVHSFEVLFKGLRAATEMSMWAIIGLHRSSIIAKATKDKALVVAEKWKASKKKAREDVKF